MFNMFMSQQEESKKEFIELENKRLELEQKQMEKEEAREKNFMTFMKDTFSMLFNTRPPLMQPTYHQPPPPPPPPPISSPAAYHSMYDPFQPGPSRSDPESESEA